MSLPVGIGAGCFIQSEYLLSTELVLGFVLTCPSDSLFHQEKVVVKKVQVAWVLVGCGKDVGGDTGRCFDGLILNAGCWSNTYNVVLTVDCKMHWFLGGLSLQVRLELSIK